MSRAGGVEGGTTRVPAGCLDVDGLGGSEDRGRGIGRTCWSWSWSWSCRYAATAEAELEVKLASGIGVLQQELHSNSAERWHASDTAE